MKITEKNGIVKIALDQWSYIKLDLNTIQNGFTEIAGGIAQPQRKGKYTTLVKEAKKFAMSLGYKGICSVARHSDGGINEFWDSFIQKNEVVVDGTYFY
jgi:hypothetical protein